eukprot:COSAG02_NODE_41003_length_399_cov_0.816667_1_plen_31_part_01
MAGRALLATLLLLLPLATAGWFGSDPAPPPP